MAQSWYGDRVRSVSFEFVPGRTIKVTIPTSSPTFVSAPKPPGPTIVIPVQGPPGPRGYTGYAEGYPDWFAGEGPPPDALIGASPGDMYLDTLPGGLIYQLR